MSRKKVEAMAMLRGAAMQASEHVGPDAWVAIGASLMAIADHQRPDAAKAAIESAAQGGPWLPCVVGALNAWPKVAQ